MDGGARGKEQAGSLTFRSPNEIVTMRSRLFSGLKFMSMVNITCDRIRNTTVRKATQNTTGHHSEEEEEEDGEEEWEEEEGEEDEEQKEEEEGRRRMAMRRRRMR